MNIRHYDEAIKNCRFCFMCRHLSGVANVSFNEADTPRVRAAALYAISNNPAALAEPDFIRTMYDSDLTKACTYHCVSHYPETELVLAARRDIVESGLAPEAVRQLADRLEESAGWTVSGSGSVLYFEDECTGATPAIAAAFARAAGREFRTVRGGCIGKALHVLGFAKRAALTLKKFASFINGLGAETLVVSNPAACDALVNDCRNYGIELQPKVMHSSEYLAGLRLPFRREARSVYYLESDFLRNYLGGDSFPHELLKQLGVECRPFGTNDEESYSAGEAALLLDELNPALAAKLAAYTAARVDDPAKDLLVTASPHTRRALSGCGLNVVTLEELAAGRL